jgi:signal transduction histidine kinase
MTSRNGVGFERLPPGHRHALPDSRCAGLDELHRQIELVSHNPVVTAVLGAADAVLLVLNGQRQIVAFNSRVAAVSRISDVSGVLGLRPGETFQCVNAAGPGGCGAAPACETCGALGAILACQRNRRSAEAECLIRTRSGKDSALEFNVRATPVVLGGSPFTVVSLRDISSEKRKQALEQIFFHDILNTVTALRSWTAVLRRPGVDHQRAGERVDLISRQLEREIRDQRALALAESGTLVAMPQRVRAADLLRDLEFSFSSHFAAEGRRLELEAVPPEAELESDPSLALRVLANMVRNALEATAPGGAVRVGCEPARWGDGDGDAHALRFIVRNQGYIPPEIQAHVFQRSFSTKAHRGRGLGTYSMKLLGEGYLGGKVSFASEVHSGTMFFLELPVEFPRVPEQAAGAQGA